METQEILDNTCEQVERQIKEINKQGISMKNIDFLGKLVDVHKDLANEDYWDTEEEKMNMRYSGNYGRDEYGRDMYGRDEYGTYGRGNEMSNYNTSYGRRSRDSRGRFTEAGSMYGAGHEMLDEIKDHYSNYSEAKDQYGRGRYGAKDEGMKSLAYMLQCTVDFVEMLKRDAKTQEELELIREYTRKLGSN